MATKNCPKCDSPNPVACKKCACGHVFFTTRRSANALAAEANDDISEPTTPQEPELPRRRTARVTRERPQFYDALQVENQTRRQRELQKRRKASKSDDTEAGAEEIPEKAVVAPTTSKRRVESPPPKAAEPLAKKRRGRPPGLTNRRSGRAQILASKPTDAMNKGLEGQDGNLDGELEGVAGIHDVPPLKALQMNMVLSDINSRISSSSVRADSTVLQDEAMETSEIEKPEDETESTKSSPEKARNKRKSGKVAAAKADSDDDSGYSLSKVKPELSDSDEEACGGKSLDQPSSGSLPTKKDVKKEVESESIDPKSPKADIKEAEEKKLEVDESSIKAEEVDSAEPNKSGEASPEKVGSPTTASEPDDGAAQPVSSTSKGCAFPC